MVLFRVDCSGLVSVREIGGPYYFVYFVMGHVGISVGARVDF